MSTAESAQHYEYAFTDGDFKFIQDSIRTLAGIAIADHKKEMVYGRVARRVRALQLDSVKAYCEYITKPENQSELTEFINSLTTNLTRFFRESHHFDHLAATVLAPLAKHTGPKKLKLWSAGCSSGMEAYTVAMTIAEHLPNWKQWDIKILATDIDTKMLSTGAAGIYAASAAQDIPRALFQKYCVRVADEKEKFQIVPELRSMVHFKYLNLLTQEWPMKNKFDVIFCRNVMIYFDKPSQTKLCGLFAKFLHPHAWLYIGHSEHVHGQQNTLVPSGHTIYQRTGAPHA